MKFDIEKHRDHCIASDTDSCFFSAEPLINKLGLEKEEEIIEKVREVAHKYSIALNKQMDVFSSKLFNVKKHKFDFKTESILKSAYWAGKRRYAQYIVDKEGVKVEELDMKGLDLMKSNFPPLFKKFGEGIIKDIMFGKTKSDIDKNILEFRESLQKIDWKKLLKPTGLKKLGEYIADIPREGEIFTHLKSRCPINTRSAIQYNDILKHKKLDDKYPLFQVGDKMYISYLKDNPYKIEVVGFNGYNDPPEIIDLINNFVDRNKIFDSVLKNKIDNLYLDLGWDLPVYNKNINKFFKF